MVLSVTSCCGPGPYGCSCGPPRGRGTPLVVRLRWPGSPCEAEAVISCSTDLFRPAGPAVPNDHDPSDCYLEFVGALATGRTSPCPPSQRPRQRALNLLSRLRLARPSNDWRRFRYSSGCGSATSGSFALGGGQTGGQRCCPSWPTSRCWWSGRPYCSTRCRVAAHRARTGQSGTSAVT